MNSLTSRLRHSGATLLVVALSANFLFSQENSVSSSEEETVYTLSPFEVSPENNSSYYGSNSVSGTRTRTDLKNLAMSIQVLTDDFIEDTGAHELIDVVTYASGASVGVSGTSGVKDDDDNTSFTLRGVATYLPMRNGFRRLRLVSGANIQQVEILKGPASLLYGQLAPGGTVNYITKRATASDSFGSANVAIGSYDLKKATLDYNYAVVPEVFGFRFVGSFMDRESIEDRYERSVSLLNPTMVWTPTEKTKVTLDYEINAADSTAPVGNLPWNDDTYLLDDPGQVDRSFNTRTSGDYIDTTMTTTSIDVVHEFNDHFTVRGNWTESIWEMDKRVNSTSSSLNNDTRLIGNRSLQYRKWGSWDTFAVLELVNSFSTDSFKMQNIFGYQDAELQFRNVYTGRNAPGVSNPSIRWNIDDPSTWILTELTEDDTVINTGATGNMSTNLNTSYYFTNQLTFLDGKLHTLAGIRFEQLDTDFYRNSTDTHTITEAKDAKVPQFGALYKVTSDFSVYASYSESFNPAFATLRDENGDYFTPVPEAGEGYDLGIKLDVPDANLSMTAALFTIDRTNIIKSLPPVDDPDAPGSTFNPSRQSGLENSSGFEMDIRWSPSEKFQLIGSYGYTDAKVESDEQEPEIHEGHDLGNAPKHTLAVFLRRNFGGFGPFEKTYFTLGGRAISSRATNSAWIETSPGVIEEPPRMPGYEVLDLGFGGKIVAGEREYDLRINVKNALDEVYLAHRYAFGDPRLVEFSVKTKF